MNNKVDADATGWAEKLKCLVNEHGSQYYTPEEIDVMLLYVRYMGLKEIDDEEEEEIDDNEVDEINDEDEDEIDDEEEGWAKGLKCLINEYGSQYFTPKEIDDMLLYIDYMNYDYVYDDAYYHDDDGNYIDIDVWNEEFMGFIDEYSQYFSPEEIDDMILYINSNERRVFFDMLIDCIWDAKIPLKKSIFKRLQYYFPMIATPNRIDLMEDLEKRVIPD